MDMPYVNSPVARSVRVAAMEDLPVSLAEAKAWIAAHLPDDDALLAGLIRSAAEMCEAHIGQMLMVREVVEVMPIAAGACGGQGADDGGLRLKHVLRQAQDLR